MCIYKLGTFDLRITILRVTNHIAIGKVSHDQVVLLFDAVQNLLGDLCQTQFGQLIKWNTFWRWNAYIVLAGERLVVAAVEEKRDVRVFFRFGDAQLTQARATDDFAQGVLDPGGGKGHRQVLELFVV